MLKEKSELIATLILAIFTTQYFQRRILHYVPKIYAVCVEAYSSTMLGDLRAYRGQSQISTHTPFGLQKQ